LYPTYDGPLQKSRKGCSVGSNTGHVWDLFLPAWLKWCLGQDSCPRSLSILQRQTELSHPFWIWDRLSIEDRVIINIMIFVEYDDVCLTCAIYEHSYIVRCNYILAYFVISTCILSLLVMAEYVCWNWCFDFE